MAPNSSMLAEKSGPTTVVVWSSSMSAAYSLPLPDCKGADGVGGSAAGAAGAGDAVGEGAGCAVCSRSASYSLTATWGHLGIFAAIKVEDSVVAELTELYWKVAKMLPWQVGDMIMLDNMLTSHARMPFTGPRKIVVAMGEMLNARDLL